MKHTLQHITLVLLALVFTACVTETVSPVAGSKGTFSVGLEADSLEVVVDTRAPRTLTADEGALFRLTLTDKEGTVWENLPYAELSLSDRTQPVASGYILSAQNCTEEEAESQNDGWGQRRFYGQSSEFAIAKDKDTRVDVACRMANAGLAVVFDDTFREFFTAGYAVTTIDNRTLRFDATNLGRTAYYNVADGETHSVHLLITASAGWDGQLRLERDIVLQPGRTCRLVLYKGERPTGTLGLTITYDDTFDEGTTEEIILD